MFPSNEDSGMNSERRSFVKTFCPGWTKSCDVFTSDDTWKNIRKNTRETTLSQVKTVSDRALIWRLKKKHNVCCCTSFPLEKDAAFAACGDHVLQKKNKVVTLDRHRLSPHIAKVLVIGIVVEERACGGVGTPIA